MVQVGIVPRFKDSSWNAGKVKKSMASKKKPRKQKTKTLKRLPPKIKISEAILKLSEPLRQKYRDSHRTQVIISMSVMAWNISLFPKAEQVNAQGMLLDALPETFSAEDISYHS
jgi:hypothetical protein